MVLKIPVLWKLVMSTMKYTVKEVTVATFLSEVLQQV